MKEFHGHTIDLILSEEEYSTKAFGKEMQVANIAGVMCQETETLPQRLYIIKNRYGQVGTTIYKETNPEYFL